MRANEPFHGIVLVGGSVVFHIALLVGSLFVVRFPEVNEKNKELLALVDLFRAAHAINVLYSIVDYCLSAPEKFAKFMFTQKLFETFSMFSYFLVAMYALWDITGVTVTEKDIEKEPLLYKEETWVYIELTGFFLQIFSGAFFLFYQQIRGLLGYTLDVNMERHKSDALAYYMTDVQWFNLIFVLLNIHVMSIISNLPKENKSAEPIKLVYSSIMIATRVLQLYFLLPYKTHKRRIREVSKKVWCFFAFMEMVGLGLTLGFKSYRGITSACSLMEITVFIGQYVQWQISWSVQKSEEGGVFGNVAPDVSEDIRNQLEDAKKLLDKPKRDYVVEDSIYNFAIYSLIHPDVIKQWPQNGEYATGIKLSQNERESVFQGAVALVFIQLSMIALVIKELSGTPVIRAQEFHIVIPRVIAAFFMHANLQSEIKSGMRTMKYVAQHPYSFRKFDPRVDEDDDVDYESEEEKYEGLYVRVLYAFLFGFFQTAMGLVLEAMSIYYLCCKDSFRLILMSYATMASIAAFDDLYSKSLLEHPIRSIIGKKIFQAYRRSMRFQGATIKSALESQKLQKSTTISGQRDSDIDARANLVGMTDNHDGAGGGGDGAEGGGEISSMGKAMLAAMTYENPDDVCFFKILQGIRKFIRLFYMSFFFYFAPFGMLIYQFYVNKISMLSTKS